MALLIFRERHSRVERSNSQAALKLFAKHNQSYSRAAPTPNPTAVHPVVLLSVLRGSQLRWKHCQAMPHQLAGKYEVTALQQHRKASISILWTWAIGCNCRLLDPCCVRHVPPSCLYRPFPSSTLLRLLSQLESALSPNYADNIQTRTLIGTMLDLGTFSRFSFEVPYFDSVKRTDQLFTSLAWDLDW